MKPTQTFEDVEAHVVATDSAGIEASAELIDALVYYVGDGYALSPQLNAAVHRHSKFAQIRDGIRAAIARREAELPDCTPPSFAEYVADPEFDQSFVDGVVRNARSALDRNNFMSAYQPLSSMCESALGGGPYICTLLDRVLADLETHKRFAGHPVGASLRLFFRRVRFMALRGTARSLELVLPGDDVRWVDCVNDAIGYRTELLGLSDDERTRLANAWSALDWDGTLRVESAVGREVERPATTIEERPWDELAEQVMKTSFRRLTSGEKHDHTVTRLFRRPVPLDARIALAESLVAFASSHRALGKDARAVVLAAITPHLDGRKLTGALAGRPQR